MWNIEKIVKKGDYLYAVVKEHPKATKHGYVLLHRVVMENHLNRLLNEDEVVHHRNKNKKDCLISNLELTNNSEHARLHGQEQGQEWFVLKCPNCGVEFHRRSHNLKHRQDTSSSYCSKKCGGEMSAKIQHGLVTPEMKGTVSANIVRTYVKYVTDNTEET